MSRPKPSDKSLFLAALEIESVADRAAFMQQACGDDDQLREEIESLLDAHGDPPEVLRQMDDVRRTIDRPLTEAPGTLIGRYKLLELIGEGGFGDVYLAEQTEPVHRQVALKVIKLGMDTRQVIARFEVERQALALMDHPNIAKVLDAGATETGRPYFVMEIVRGVAITQYCDQRNLTTEDRLKLFVVVCHAVEHAHQKGVIHRDIKPSNVLVTQHDGVPMPMVIDFGIAKATSQRLTEKTLFTEHHQLIGTPEYMSPEQAEFSDHNVDTRSDIYSLGVLLYELLVGGTPFDAQDLRDRGYDEICRVIRESDPPTPSRRLATLGAAATETSRRRQSQPAALGRLLRGDLDWIVMKALEKDRARRYETVLSFAHDIERHLDDQPVQACPPSAVYQARKFVRRNKAAVLAAASLLLALTFGAVGTTTGWIRAVQASAEAHGEATRAWRGETNAREQRNRAIQQQNLAQQRESTARRLLYSAHMKLAHLAHQRGNHERMLQLVEDYLPAPGEEDLREFEWYYLWRLSHRESQTLYTGAHSVAFSPDGKALAANDAFHGSVRLWDAATGRLRQAFEGHRGCSCCVAFSPQGNVMASGSGIAEEPGEVKLWDLATGECLATLPAGPLGISTLDFSPDGKSLATGSSGHLDRKRLPGEVMLWDVTTRQPRVTLRKHKWGVSCVVFAPDGQSVASSSYSGEVVLCDAAEGREVATLRSPAEGIEDDNVHGIAFSPDGSVLAMTVGQTIELWDTRSKQRRSVVKLSEDALGASAFSPDGNTLAAACRDGAIRLWDIRTAQLKEKLVGHSHWAWAVAFSPDGTKLASASKDRTVKVWDLTTGRLQVPAGLGLQAPDGEEGDVSRSVMDVSADGRLLALATDKNRVLLWDTAAGQERIRIAVQNGPVSSAAFSPDGTILVTAARNDASDGLVTLWDVATGQERERLGSSGSFGTVAFSPSGQHLAAADGNDIVLWDMATGTYRATTLEGHNSAITSLAFSPDCQLLASASREESGAGGLWGKEGEVRLWDVQTGQLRLSRSWMWHVNDVAFSPDGRILAAGGGFYWQPHGSGGSAQLWDVSTGDVLATLDRHAGLITGVAFSPDGRTLATCSEDGKVKLWSTDAWQEKFELPWEGQEIADVMFSADGHSIVASSAEGDVKVWTAASGQDVAKNLAAVWQRRAKRRARLRQWPEAEADYSKSLEQQAHDWTAWYGRGEVRAEMGHWPAAAADLSKAIDLETGAAEVWHALALVHLAQHDTSAYRRVCESMIDRLGETEHLRSAKIVAWSCALAPHAVTDLRSAVVLAEKAIQAKKHASYFQTHGAVLYRDDQFKDAIRQLQRAKELPREPYTASRFGWTPARGWFYLAMAHHRLGHEAEAARWLDKAVTHSEKLLRQHDDRTGRTLPWYQRVTYRLLREEAEKLIRVTVKDPRRAEGELPSN